MQGEKNNKFCHFSVNVKTLSHSNILTFKTMPSTVSYTNVGTQHTLNYPKDLDSFHAHTCGAKPAELLLYTSLNIYKASTRTHWYNLRAQEAEAGRSGIQSQHVLHREPLFQINKTVTEYIQLFLTVSHTANILDNRIQDSLCLAWLQPEITLGFRKSTANMTYGTGVYSLEHPPCLYGKQGKCFTFNKQYQKCFYFETASLLTRGPDRRNEQVSWVRARACPKSTGSSVCPEERRGEVEKVASQRASKTQLTVLHLGVPIGFPLKTAGMFPDLPNIYVAARKRFKSPQISPQGGFCSNNAPQGLER